MYCSEFGRVKDVSLSHKAKAQNPEYHDYMIMMIEK